MKYYTGIITLVAILTFTLLFCSCGNQSNFLTKNDKEEEDVFLFQQSDGVMSYDEPYSSPQEYGIHTESDSVKMDELKDRSLSIPFLNDTFVYSTSTLKLKAKTPGEYSDLYGNYDSYYSKHAVVNTFCNTDNMIFFADAEGFDNCRKQPSRFSDEEIEKKANEFLLTFWDAADLGLYNERFVQTTFWACTYTVTYNKYIHGYKTEDFLMVGFDDDAELIYYNGQNPKKLDPYLNSIEKDALDRTYKKLSDKIDSSNYTDLKKSDPKLITNTDGELFMSVEYQYSIQPALYSSDEEVQYITTSAELILAVK